MVSLPSGAASTTSGSVALAALTGASGNTCVVRPRAIASGAAQATVEYPSPHCSASQNLRSANACVLVYVRCMFCTSTWFIALHMPRSGEDARRGLETMRKYLVAAVALAIAAASGSIPASAQPADRFGRPAPYSGQRYMSGDQGVDHHPKNSTLPTRHRVRELSTTMRNTVWGTELRVLEYPRLNPLDLCALGKRSTSRNARHPRGSDALCDSARALMCGLTTVDGFLLAVGWKKGGLG